MQNAAEERVWAHKTNWERHLVFGDGEFAFRLLPFSDWIEIVFDVYFIIVGSVVVFFSGALSQFLIYNNEKEIRAQTQNSDCMFFDLFAQVKLGMHKGERGGGVVVW